jgi:uncharacterized protein (TIGR00369 family)
MNMSTPIDIEQISGLELIRMMQRGEYPLPAMCDTIPMSFTEVEKGEVKMTAIADRRHLNASGAIHGGFAATVIDSATGCAVYTMMSPGERYTTITLEVKMLRPPPINETMLVEGRLLNISKRLAVADAEIRNSEGKLIAQGVGTCMVFR